MSVLSERYHDRGNAKNENEESGQNRKNGDALSTMRGSLEVRKEKIRSES